MEAIREFNKQEQAKVNIITKSIEREWRNKVNS